MLRLHLPDQPTEPLTPEQIAGIRRNVLGYVDNARQFKSGLKRIA